MFPFVLKRVVIVIVAGLVAVAVAYAGTRGSQASYDSSAEILVDQPQTVGLPSGAANIQKIQILTPTYAQIITSTSFAEQMAKKLPQYTASEIQGVLSATAIDKTQILQINTHANDAQEAIAVAQTAAQTFINNVNDQQNQENVTPDNRLQLSIIQPALTASENAPHRDRTMGIAFAAVAVISIGGIVVYENARRA